MDLHCDKNITMTCNQRTWIYNTTTARLTLCE